MAEFSPMMQQYFEIKNQNKGAILFFRLGDFYEMFFEDARLASKELELTLTGRDCGQGERAPMCGVPYHSSEAYIAKLVAKGYKVAICEQMENPSEVKGIVKREVTRIITPGTVVESSMLDETKNNFISSVFADENFIGVCFCDVSTGALFATKLDRDRKNGEAKAINEIGKFMPSEILICGGAIELLGLPKFIKEKLSASVEMIEDDRLDAENFSSIILNHFNKDKLEYVNMELSEPIIVALGALLVYIKQNQKSGLERINKLEIYSEKHFMRLDLNTRRNLELVETMRNKEKRGSLLYVIDKTKTAMGKRLIKSWIEQPLLSCAKISKRQDAVEELCSNRMLADDISEILSGVYDIERLMSRVVYGAANGRELRSLAFVFNILPGLKDRLALVSSTLLKEIYNDIDSLEDVYKEIDDSIVEEPPISVREGDIIKTGYNEEIDFLRGDMSDSKGIMARIEAQEKERTGITKLKIGYNRVFGYYIEVTNSFKHLVPGEYIRKQTLTNCERYITQELKEIEGRILGSKEKVLQLEYETFEKIRKFVASQLLRVQKTANMIAQLDVIVSLARVAAENNYIRPIISLDGEIVLKDSRHPVVETLLDGAPFVPNDVHLDKNENRVAIITGPNMAGKSTYMRQVAVIVLMAQMGSFVPASYAKISIVDSVFTRVGASDDLASGQSTFMVEMNEVAGIIDNATSDSLLILDEIGRGTSTFDGMSIARAVVEYVADKKKLGSKTLFATHYHELTELEDLVDGIKNYNIAVKKRGDDITFLRRIVRGGADDSYGIEVAKLAGLPESIIKRSKSILKELETNEFDHINQEKLDKDLIMSESKNRFDIKSEQLSFIPSIGDKIVEKLKNIDVNTLTPIESMQVLFELSKIMDDK